jgi:hypothetical protein
VPSTFKLVLPRDVTTTGLSPVYSPNIMDAEPRSGSDPSSLREKARVVDNEVLSVDRPAPQPETGNRLKPQRDYYNWIWVHDRLESNAAVLGR